ncbi:MAG: AHA1, activator of heat shock 90kDa protein ATPase [Marteilia pararefringens]
MKKFGQKNMKDSADKMYEDLAVIDEVKDTASQSSAKVHNSGSDEHTNANNNPTKDVDSHHYDGKLNFELSEDFNHGLAALYKLFTEDSSLSYLTNTTCDFTLEAGAKFTWIDGQIEGICVEYLNEELLALDVRFSSWPADAKLSRVIVKFEKKSEDLIHITIRQYNIESNDDVESFKSFWNSQFFENIRRMCGQIM